MAANHVNRLRDKRKQVVYQRIQNIISGGGGGDLDGGDAATGGSGSGADGGGA